MNLLNSLNPDGQHEIIEILESNGPTLKSKEIPGGKIPRIQ